MAKARKYLLTGGPHVTMEKDKSGKMVHKQYVKGDVITSDVDLVAKFPSKFKVYREPPKKKK